MENIKQERNKHEIWDCGNSLYDSFELKSLHHQLNSAISARSLSIPHLSHRRQPPPPPPTAAKKHSRFHKLLKSLFRTKHTRNIVITTTSTNESFYDKSGALSTIPEVAETVPEFDGLSPEMRSLVTRTRSDRFMSAASSVGISCI
ncbi:uncharacterized protein LOC143531291 [Bidens hawaiensis]|uniref:uncharacterized protein LOC143531291 n=1 Tax=Bidens hawaiensis TaxID=980011 RepID=UPI00404B21E8